MNKLLFIFPLACVVCQSLGQVLPITFYDQAPAYMTHSRFPSGYWDVYYFYDYPLNGTSGTANNTFGFSSSDFEVPLFMLQGFTNYSKNNDKAPIIEGETGLVGARCSKADGSENCGRLGPDGTPSYAYTDRSPLGSVSSPTTFYDFFHSTARTSVVPGNIALTTAPNNPSLKSFNSFAYFPLDGLGWNDTFSYLDVNGIVQQHNFAWCFTAHTGFTYRGDEFFDFLGDDDFFVYINGYLVIDLGGVHTASNASVNVNSLGLTVGSNYTFDMFYCNRHTADSVLTFETNIVFACQGTSCTTVPTPVPITTTVPTTATPTTKPATTAAPSTGPATTAVPTSQVPTTNSVTTTAPTTRSATTVPPTTKSAVTIVPTTPVLTTSAPTIAPSTPVVTTVAPTTATVTTSAPTTAVLTTAAPKTLVAPTTPTPITTVSTTAAPTTAVPTPVTTSSPTTASPTTSAATTTIPTTIAPSTASPTSATTTVVPTTATPSTFTPSTASPTTSAATTVVPTTVIPSTSAPTTVVTTTASVTTARPTSSVATTMVPTSITPTAVVTTSAPTATHVVPTSTPTTSRPVISASVCVTVSMVTAVASIAVILGF